MRRVAVTGIGVLSPLGNSLEGSWEALKAGKSGIGPITRFEPGPARCESPPGVAGELKGFDAGRFVSRKDIRRLDPFVHYAVAASVMAVEDAGLSHAPLSDAGVVIGSSRGGVTDTFQRTSAYLMSATTIGMAASSVARRLGIKGHTLGISNACASGANAIGEAFRLIKHGLADVAMAGGAEAPVCSLYIRGYGASGALSISGVSRPFDKKRDGFVIAEGAAILVLEEYESAIKRRALPYGEVIGYGNTTDAFHQTVPDKDGQMRAMGAALKEAGISPADVDLISAHATSTPIGDKAEAEAIRTVFGATIPVNAAKSMTGHMLGASGAFEAAMALMSIREGVVPPTINLSEPEYGLNLVARLVKTDVKTVVTNSFGFGGVNAVLVLRGLEAS